MIAVLQFPEEDDVSLEGVMLLNRAVRSVAARPQCGGTAVLQGYCSKNQRFLRHLGV
jgi:hypothetical protein